MLMMLIFYYYNNSLKFLIILIFVNHNGSSRARSAMRTAFERVVNGFERDSPLEITITYYHDIPPAGEAGGKTINDFLNDCPPAGATASASGREGA